MFDFPILNVAIGLIFIFLLYSSLASTTMELIASLLALRAKGVEKALTRMLIDSEDTIEELKTNVLLRIWQFWKRLCKWLVNPLLVKKEHKVIQELYKTPLISSFNSGSNHNRPSYLSAESFAKSLVFLLKKPFEDTDSKPSTETSENANTATEAPAKPTTEKPKNDANTTIENIKKNINNPKHPLFKDEGKKLQELLHYFWEEIPGESDQEKVKRFNANIESWYNQTMDRAAGWYKKNTTVYLLIIGFVLANIFQVNTIHVAQKLYSSTETQEEILAMVPLYQKTTLSGDSLDYGELMSKRDSIMKGIEASNNVLIPEQQYPDAIPVKINNATAHKNALASYFTINKNTRAYYTSIKNISTAEIQANYKLEPKFSEENKVYQLKINKYSYYYNMLKANFWGYLITAIAISLGSKFWYEMLNKIVNLKSSISPAKK